MAYFIIIPICVLGVNIFSVSHRCHVCEITTIQIGFNKCIVGSTHENHAPYYVNAYANRYLWHLYAIYTVIYMDEPYTFSA